MYGYTIRTLAILVLRIIPYFVNRNFSLLNLMCIDQIIAFDFGSIASYFIFLNGIFDFFTTVIFWQIFKCIRPITRYLLILNLFTISHQSNGNLVRTFTILIVIIFPCFLTADIDCFGLMRIGDGESICCCSIDRGIIAIHFIFTDRILDRLAFLLGIQIGKGSTPVIVCIQYDSFSRIVTISK